MKFTTRIFLFIILTFSANSFAIGEIAKPLQQQWDVTSYNTPEKERKKAFAVLAKQAKEVEQQHPDNAEVLVWEAIILSTYAGEKGGFGALGLVKEAKALLEKAEKIDPSTLNGSIYTSLGSLYYQVPGWPLGFGDDDLALAYLNKALKINPDGIDSNYFYGDFMLEKGEYKKAIRAFDKALTAPPRINRPIADSGRKKEIEIARKKAKAHDSP
ncbi:MAG: hypothetical protein GXP14_09425 [Gammaproteobacteria bacterium]|nr:hypothetical protein [Gammaproteobacteria bacterium]